jgi:hypothetical protein
MPLRCNAPCKAEQGSSCVWMLAVQGDQPLSPKLQQPSPAVAGTRHTLTHTQSGATNQQDAQLTAACHGREEGGKSGKVGRQTGKGAPARATITQENCLPRGACVHQAWYRQSTGRTRPETHPMQPHNTLTCMQPCIVCPHTKKTHKAKGPSMREGLLPIQPACKHMQGVWARKHSTYISAG